ncbi:MAG TPA: DNA polymerase IV [Nitrospiraceae bacterium]|nr:DNA polymerase IV [Nitrospiraceae bacterium]
MARWSRQIVFGDVDAMFASSAIVANPALVGKLVAVGSPSPRGIIVSASYPARRFGVKAAMPTAQALRLCPDLVLVPLDRPLYQRMHERMREVTDRLFPITEWTSIDEFYADTTDFQSLHPDPAVLSRAVKSAIFEATGLRCTVAIATGKTIAKVAADAHKPDGLVVVEPGREATFLAPRPVRSLPGVGPKTAAELDRLGIHLIGDLLEPRYEPLLRRLWGKHLRVLQALARGDDHDPVLPDRDQKSLGHETTFDQDTDDLTFLERTVRGFLSTLAHELRVQGLAAGAFTVKLKDAKFKITTRQRHFAEPLNYDPLMWSEIRDALRSLIVSRTRYRLIGLSLSDLVPATESLFDQRTTKAIAAMDAIIEKHGARVMRLGGLPEE